MAARRATPWLAFVALLAFACSPPREDEAARIINGLTHAAVMDGTTDGELPANLDCPKSKAFYEFIGNGDTSWVGFAMTGTTVDFRVEMLIDAKGDSIFPPDGGEGEFSLKCFANIQYDFDFVTLKASGPGRIVNCDEFTCKVNKVKISCKDLEKALVRADCL